MNDEVNMTIGEQLKATRKMLGLTQMQMCQNVISESFYSKVERDKSRIDTDDLIQILNNHKVSLYDFFAPFDKHSINRKMVNAEIIYAFNRRDIKELKSIQAKILNDEKLTLRIKLMIALLQNKIAQLPDQLRQEIRFNTLQIGNWNKEALWELSIIIDLYDFDELTILLDSIFTQYSEIDTNDQEVVALLATIFVNYLVKCQKVINYIENLKSNPDIALVKIVGKYYQALIDQDKINANKIRGLLVNSGYIRYL